MGIWQSVKNLFKKGFTPIKDRTLKFDLFTPKPAPLPSPEGFQSPLQLTLTELMQKKELCAYNCAGCTYQSASGCRIDTEIRDAITTQEDPQPWLMEVHRAIVENTAEQKTTQKVIKEESALYQPSKRLLIGTAAASGGTLGALAVKVFWEIYFRDWLLAQVAPFMVPLIPQLLAIFGL